MSCCPPNAEKYLAATGSNAGQCVTHESGQELYMTGSAAESKKGVLIIPDVYGWNSGRTRHIADMFAEANYLAVVPKLLAPGLKGGTDGDGLYPSFSFATDGAEFGPFMTQYDWKGWQKNDTQ
jgi:dienelactone hydrolase